MTVVKSIIKHVIDLFAHICNLSLSTGNLPDEMKIAKVIPLHKEINHEFNNYRPVSQLS